MADANGDDSITIQIEQVTEGDRIETDDYFFCKIGEPVPLLSDAGTPFELDSFPATPLVVSHRSHLVFVAHSSGFCVAKIEDVIASAKRIKDKGEEASVKESSFVDVSIGRVHILALSLDSSYLAAVVDEDIHCFSVDSLLAKDQKPIFSCSVESDCIKDLLWAKNGDPSFFVLTNIGKLYVGGLNKPLKYVKDEIDAVERSADGHLLAVVRSGILSIFSSNLKEILRFSLPLNSLMGDSAAGCSIKVDSIRWVRSDSIVVGGFQQTEDGMEEGYFLQVITSKDGKISDGSSKLSALCFSDLFPGIIDDIVPFGRGPHLFMKYLGDCGLGFISNRKNTDQHIMLLMWSPENSQVSVVDIERDTWLPRIELQENGDDNLVLGLCIDKIPVCENVKVQIGAEEHKELLPLCILICLTLEGKLIIFNVASITGPQYAIQDLSAASNAAESVPVVGTSYIERSPLLEEEKTKQSGPYELHAKKNSLEANEIPVRSDPKPSMSNYFNFAPNSDFNVTKESIPVNNKEKASVDVETRKPLVLSGYSSQGTSNQLFGKNSHMEGSTVVSDIARNTKWNIEADQPLGKTTYNTSSSISEKTGSGFSQSNPGPTTSSNFLSMSSISTTKSSVSAPSTTKSTFFKSVQSSTNAAENTENVSGSRAASEAKLGFSGFNMQPQHAALQNSIDHSHSVKVNHKTLTKSNTNLESAKQFHNVQHMEDELDQLLESIEEAGGFRDVCTTAHKGSLEMLEEGMRILSERTRGWQSFTEKQLLEIQLLLDKTLQVLARKTHIEAIVRQTTDRQYWELWDRQKLSSELDLKRQNLLNLSQDLINQMIGLEKHFNALELNLFGESGRLNTVSQATQYKCTPPRHTQSIHAVHKALVSQLAAAQQLSDSLAGQMDSLSLRSPPEKEKSVKKKLFESIGLPFTGDYRGSPDVRKTGYSSNKKPSASPSDSSVNVSRKNHGFNSHDQETARRRRDSLDRNWANFEAPKTTVKRMLVENQRQNDSGSSSFEKRLVSPGKFEGSAAAYPKVLSVQDTVGSTDKSKKLNSEASSSSVFKWAGANAEMSKAEAQSFPRPYNKQGSGFSTGFCTTASSSQFSPPPSFMDHATKQNNQSTEMSGAQVGHTDKSESALIKDFKPSSSQFDRDKSTFPRMQPQMLSSSVRFSETSISSSKEIASTFIHSGRSSLSASAHHTSVFPTLGSPSICTTSGSASSSFTATMPALPITPIEGGSLTSIKVTNAGNNQVSPSVISAVPIPPTEAQVDSVPSKSPSNIDTKFKGSTMNSAGEPQSQPPVNKVDEKASPASALQPPKVLSLASEGLKCKGSTQSANLNEDPKANVSGRPHDLKTTVTPTSDTVSNGQPKDSTTFGMPSLLLSDSVGANGGKSTVDAVLAQEDEMEEEAPEMNQTAGLSLGSLSGFGIGSTPSPMASRSNPFGASATVTTTNMPSSVSLTVPSGEVFRPASFSFQSLNPSQQSQPPFGSASPMQQPSPGGGFGQPAQIGMGQQALGSVLGSFGQSRQIGGPMSGSGFGAGGFQSTATSGGFSGVAATGGFQSAATGRGFAGVAVPGGFQSAATSGGFAGVSAPGGGFAGLGNMGSGFAGAATAGGFGSLANNTGGFGGAAGGGGGFSAFGKQGNSGFSTLGSGAGSRPPPPELFTQMRK